MKLKSLLKEATASKQEPKKPVKEIVNSLAAYYNQAGMIGQGSYNLRNVLEEIDDILIELNADTRAELVDAISNAIDMAYEAGMQEAEDQANDKF